MITPAELQKVLPLSSVTEGASAETPLDREIASLLQDGKIREELKEFAHLHARTAVYSGVRQAEYYSRRVRSASRLNRRKKLADKLRMDVIRLDQLALVGGEPTLAEPLAQYPHGLSSLSFTAFWHKVTTARKHLELIIKAIEDNPLPEKRGRQGDTWLHGYIYELGRAWCELTGLRASSESAGFMAFLQSSLDSITPTREIVSSSVVRTAVHRFGMDQDDLSKWLQPGTDLEPHSVTGSR